MNRLRLNSQLLQVPLYIAGKSTDQVCQELGLNEALKLGSNENPLGPSPMALAALRDSFAKLTAIPALLTTMYGGQAIRVDPGPDYHMDLPAMADAVTDRTRIVWLCSPNNPTGLVLSQQTGDNRAAGAQRAVFNNHEQGTG